MPLRWKKNPRPTGLARIAAGPRGSTLSDGGVRYATTSFISERFGHTKEGWYWVAGWGSGVPHTNTCHDPVEDEATSKAQAMAYVKKHIRATKETA